MFSMEKRVIKHLNNVKGNVMKNVVYFFLFCTMILSLGFPVTSDSVLANEISVSTPTPPVPELEFFGHLPEEAELHHGFEEQFAFPHNLTERYQEEEYELESPVINPPTAEELAQTQAQVASYDCALVTDVPKGECEALVALYASTNGAGWSNSKNWLTSTLVGDWYGLSLYNGHVSDISLSSNQLSGTIPPELGNLTNLRSLYLYSNQLSGTIPPELGNLTDLQVFDLNDNQLSGSIPPELGNLTYLQVFDLNDNQLSGSIPPELGNLTTLIGLDLSVNQFSGDVPDSLTNLVNLCEPGNMDYPCYGIYELDLGYNYLNVPAPEPPAGFLAIKDPDWYLTQAVEADIPGETGGDLDSNDGNTEIVIPADAVEGLLTLFFVPRPYPSHNIGVLRFAGNSFKLTASIGETPIATFAKPLTLTLHYSEDALHSIPEDSLLLYYWDTDQLAWVDAVSTCEGGVYTRNFDENWLSLPICHLSEFALIGDALDIFLPVIIR